MESWIKEQQLGLFADHASASQCRLLLMHTVQRTDLARTRIAAICLRPLKTGIVIIANTRRIRFLTPSHFPDQESWLTAAAKLRPSG